MIVLVPNYLFFTVFHSDQILGPLFFNIYLADLFLFFNQIEICSYADDTTPYTCAEDLDTVILNLEEIASIFLDWFQYNHMKANAEKCHLILSTKMNYQPR